MWLSWEDRVNVPAMLSDLAAQQGLTCCVQPMEDPVVHETLNSISGEELPTVGELSAFEVRISSRRGRGNPSSKV